jgi:hypothetical protein
LAEFHLVTLHDPMLQARHRGRTAQQTGLLPFEFLVHRDPLDIRHGPSTVSQALVDPRIGNGQANVAPHLRWLVQSEERELEKAALYFSADGRPLFSPPDGWEEIPPLEPEEDPF